MWARSWKHCKTMITFDSWHGLVWSHVFLCVVDGGWGRQGRNLRVHQLVTRHVSTWEATKGLKYLHDIMLQQTEIWKCSDSMLTGKCCTLEKVSCVWWSPARCKAEAWLGSEDCSGRDLSSEPEIILYSFMRIRNVCFKVLIGQLYWKLKVKLHLFYPKSWLIPCLKIQTFEEDLTVNFKIPNSMRNETQEVLMAMFN